MSSETPNIETERQDEFAGSVSFDSNPSTVEEVAPPTVEPTAEPARTSRLRRLAALPARIAALPRETRVGLAALVSFVVLVGVFLGNRGRESQAIAQSGAEGAAADVVDVADAAPSGSEGIEEESLDNLGPVAVASEPSKADLSESEPPPIHSRPANEQLVALEDATPPPIPAHDSEFDEPLTFEPRPEANAVAQADDFDFSPPLPTAQEPLSLGAGDDPFGDQPDPLPPIPAQPRITRAGFELDPDPTGLEPEPLPVADEASRTTATQAMADPFGSEMLAPFDEVDSDPESLPTLTVERDPIPEVEDDVPGMASITDFFESTGPEPVAELESEDRMVPDKELFADRSDASAPDISAEEPPPEEPSAESRESVTSTGAGRGGSFSFPTETERSRWIEVPTKPDADRTFATSPESSTARRPLTSSPTPEPTRQTRQDQPLHDPMVGRRDFQPASAQREARQVAPLLSTRTELEPSQAQMAEQRPSSASALASESTHQHIVGPNETLRSIARQYLGDPTLEDEIFRLNQHKLREPRNLRPGLVLQVPIR